METTAESTAPVENAKADANAEATEVSGSAPDATDTGEAEVTKNSEAKRSAGDERFEKLTRERYEDRAARELAEYRAEQAEKRLAALEAQATAKREPVAPDTPPTLESVGWDTEKFTAAMDAYYERKMEAVLDRKVDERLNSREKQSSERQLRTTWSKRETDFIKSQPDYVDKVQNARTLPISQEMQQRLMSLEDGPQIALYMVDNSEQSRLIMQLPLEEQLLEVGRIRGTIAAKKAANSKPSVSQAPPPPTKVDSTSEVGLTLDPSDPASDRLSQAEWLKRREKQLAKKRG